MYKTCPLRSFVHLPEDTITHLHKSSSCEAILYNGLFIDRVFEQKNSFPGHCKTLYPDAASRNSIVVEGFASPFRRYLNTIAPDIYVQIAQLLSRKREVLVPIGPEFHSTMPSPPARSGTAKSFPTPGAALGLRCDTRPPEMLKRLLCPFAACGWCSQRVQWASSWRRKSVTGSVSWLICSM